MDKRLIMKKAHHITRGLVKEFGVDYRTQLSITLKFLYEEEKEQEQGYKVWAEGSDFVLIKIVGYKENSNAKAEQLVGVLYDNYHVTSTITEVNIEEGYAVMKFYDIDADELEDMTFSYIECLGRL
jgi:hypothetical protein